MLRFDKFRWEIILSITEMNCRDVDDDFKFRIKGK